MLEPLKPIKLKILASEDQIIKKALLGVTGGSQDVPVYGFTIEHYLCGKGRAYFS